MEPVSQGIEPATPSPPASAPKLGLVQGAARQSLSPSQKSWKAEALSIPNLLTYCRLVAVPLFVWAFLAEQYRLALALFIGASVTDALDGLLARLLRMQTRLGTFLDPIADKCLTFAALVLLVIRGDLPNWLLGLVVVRDGGIALAAAQLRRHKMIVPSTPSRFGKYATATLLATIALALVRTVHPSLALDGYVAATALLAMQCVSIAIVQYFLRWRRLIRAQ